MLSDLDKAVITSISHGNAETLLKAGLNSEMIDGGDARVIWENTVSLLRENKRVNLLSLLVRSTGQLQNAQGIKQLYSLNGTGDVSPQDVVRKCRDRYLVKEISRLNARASELMQTKPDDVATWLPTFAQKLQSLTLRARAYDPRPSSHLGPVVSPVMFRSQLPTYNKMWEGTAGDHGGYRKGWYTVWIGISGHGKTSSSYTMGWDAVYQSRRIAFISKENQSQVTARLLLALTHLTLSEVSEGKAKHQQPVIDQMGAPLIVNDSAGNPIGEWHEEKVRQYILDSWLATLDCYVRIYDWKHFGQIKNVVSWDNPDILIVDYIGPEDVSGKADTKYGLGAISSDLEETAHTTGKNIHAMFQMSNAEAIAYQKNALHIVAGPYGSGAVKHSADQVFQTRKHDSPNLQHHLKTKCRAGGPVEEFILAYDPHRWVYTERPQPHSGPF